MLYRVLISILFFNLISLTSHADSLALIAGRSFCSDSTNCPQGPANGIQYLFDMATSPVSIGAQVTTGNYAGIISLRWADSFGFVYGQNTCAQNEKNGPLCSNTEIQGFQYLHQIPATNVSIGIQYTNNSAGALFSLRW